VNPYLVTATDGHGKRDSFIRDAESLSHLRSVLEREGFSDIEYLDDDYSARLRKQRPEELRNDSAAAMRAEAKSRRGRRPGERWLLAVRSNALAIILDLGLITYGLLAWRPIPLLVGVAFLSWWIWSVRRGFGKADDYNALIRAQARGDDAECARLIDVMSRDPKLASHELLQCDLVFRRAVLKARRGDLPAALGEVEALRSRQEFANGAFEGRIGGLYYQAGDMPGYLRSMEAAYEASGHASSNRLDLAFGHARVGDAVRSRELLADVDTTLMPPFHAPLAVAAEGVLLEREGNSAAAIDKLQAAVRGLEEFSGNFAIWPFLGILVARHAAALARAGRHEEAIAALKTWREIAINCTDPDTRRTLEKELVN
jgi:tetratricopeptide (TPR) repeat protein